MKKTKMVIEFQKAKFLIKNFFYKLFHGRQIRLPQTPEYLLTEHQRERKQFWQNKISLCGNPLLKRCKTEFIDTKKWKNQFEGEKYDRE